MIDIYNTIEIAYDEDKNDWVFTLRGREYRRPSLTEAKAKIDEPVKEKKPEFKRIEAYKSERYGSDWTQVTVTSIAEGRGWHGAMELWINEPKESRYGAKFQRSKVNADHIFPMTTHNTELVEMIKSKGSDLARINDEIEKLKKKLHPFKPENYA